ncbi:MAG TPA: response regulator [Planctomycetes bacterium]|nr:response regulator [Planctomycetota bacterium]
MISPDLRGDCLLPNFFWLLRMDEKPHWTPLKSRSAPAYGKPSKRAGKDGSSLKTRSCGESPWLPPLSPVSPVSTQEISADQWDSLSILQHKVLETCALGEGTQKILDLLCGLVEEMVPGSVTSILLYDPKEGILRWGAGPNVPPPLQEHLLFLPLEIGMGSCPSSVLSRCENYVEDTLTDERWAKVRDIAEKFGILACWSLPIMDGEGEILGTFAISMDRRGGPNPFQEQLLRTARYLAGVTLLKDRLTQRKVELDRALQHGKRLESLWRLTGGIAHDFNNTLTALLAYCDLLRERVRPDGSLEPGSLKDLEELEKAAMRGVEIARKLLLFRQDEPLHPVMLEPNGIVEEICLLFRKVFGEDMEFQLSLSQKGLRIRVDEAVFGQSILYLLVNVRDQLGGGGTLLVETRMEPLFEGEDGRMGAGASFHLLVCGRHEKGFAVPLEKGLDGVLARVEGFAKNAGGSLKPGRNLDGASCWEMVLPAFTSEPQDPSSESPPLPSSEPSGPSSGELRGRGETILVCEDEPSIRTLLERLLGERGFKVLLAPNAEEAEALYQTHPARIDLLLTDLVLPRRNGFELASRLRETRKDLPVIVITGYSQEMVPPKPEGLRIPILKKPFRSEALLDLIGEFLGSTRDR